MSLFGWSFVYERNCLRSRVSWAAVILTPSVNSTQSLYPGILTSPSSPNFCADRMACNTKFDMNHLTSWFHHIPVVRWSYFAYRWFLHIMMGILLWVQYSFKVFRNMQCHTLQTYKNSTLAQPRVICSIWPLNSNLLRPRALCILNAHFCTCSNYPFISYIFKDKKFKWKVQLWMNLSTHAWSFQILHIFLCTT